MQFHQADFVAKVQSLVQRHAIKPTRLKLEITESLLLKNVENAIATMSALKEIGVRFSLDDFGTGYSSLQYLKRLPIEQLKVDQSFIRDIATDSSDKAIVCAICHGTQPEPGRYCRRGGNGRATTISPGQELHSLPRVSVWKAGTD